MKTALTTALIIASITSFGQGRGNTNVFSNLAVQTVNQAKNFQAVGNPRLSNNVIRTTSQSSNGINLRNHNTNGTVRGVSNIGNLVVSNVAEQRASSLRNYNDNVSPQMNVQVQVQVQGIRGGRGNANPQVQQSSSTNRSGNERSPNESNINLNLDNLDLNENSDKGGKDISLKLELPKVEPLNLNLEPKAKGASIDFATHSEAKIKRSAIHQRGVFKKKIANPLSNWYKRNFKRTKRTKVKLKCCF